MTIGPGKYDDLCTTVREELEADGVILIVLGGIRGHGFSCQTDLNTMARIPDLLENMARQIRKDVGN
jgi:hypothetical protein